MAKEPRLKRGVIYVSKDPADTRYPPCKVMDARQHYIRLQNMANNQSTYFVREELKKYFRPVEDESEYGLRMLAFKGGN